MLKLGRFMGGTSAAALAATAKDLLDEDEDTVIVASDEAPAPGPDDEEGPDDPDEITPPAAEVKDKPAGAAAAPKAPAAAAEGGVQGEPLNLTPEQREMFNLGAAARDMAIGTVFASKEVQGREAAAAELLAAGMPADKAIATLGKLPKGASADAMLGNLANTPNPPLAAGGDEEAARADNFGWGNAHAKVSRHRGRKSDRK